jgi:hypothetical protein
MHRKSTLAKILTTIFIVMLAVGCSDSTLEPDADALALREMAERALEVSGIDEPVLRQIFVNEVDFNPYAGSHGFAVTNKDATVGVQISVDNPNQPSDEWRVISLDFPTRYQGEGLYVDIKALNVGANAAMAAITGHWPGCMPRGQMVAWSDDGGGGNDWYLFCDISEGTISGWLDAATGEFTPSDAPPAVAPGIATPLAS